MLCAKGSQLKGELQFMAPFSPCKIDYLYILYGGSVIPTAVKTLDNKFARIIKPGRILPAVKMPDKKICLIWDDIASEVCHILVTFVLPTTCKY